MRATLTRLASLAAAALLTGSPAPAQQYTPPHFEFTAGLRDQNMPGLALEYLQKVEPGLTGSLKQRLPLEYARTRLALADATVDVAQRGKLLAQARGDLRNFLGDAAKGAKLRPVAEYQLARLTVLEAEQAFEQARSARTEDARIAQIESARPIYLKAADLYKKSSAGMQKLIDNGRAGDLGQAMRKDRLDAKFRAALALYEAARTYVGPKAVDLNSERLKLVADAIKLLKEVQRRAGESPLRYVARAWEGQCIFEQDDVKKADDVFEEITRLRPSPSTIPGKRVVDYFIVQRTYIYKSDYKKAVSMAQEWAQRYPDSLETPEGFSVRYYAARSLHARANRDIVRDPKTGSPVKPILVDSPLRRTLIQAKRIYDGLETPENRYTVRAKRAKLSLLADLVSQRSDPQTLGTFDECFAAAQVEQGKLLRRAGRAEAGLPESEVKEAYGRIVALLERGLQVLDKKGDSPRDVQQAKLMLVSAATGAGDFEKAAEKGEEFARANGVSRQALQAAVFALSSLNRMTEKAETDQAKAELDKKKLALAKFIIDTWPNESPADAARFQLGLLQYNSKQFVAAAETLGPIGPGFEGYFPAKLAQAYAANKVINAPNVDEQTKDRIRAAAIRSLTDMRLPPTATAKDAESFANATLILSGLNSRAGKHAGNQAKGREAAAALQKVDALDPQMKADLVAAGRYVEMIGLYSIVARLFNADKTDQAAKLLKPAVAEISEQSKKELAIAVREKSKRRQALDNLRQQLLGLSLRIDVSAGRVKQAGDTLELMSELGGQGGLSDQAVARLVGQVRAAIRRTAMKSEAAAKEQADNYIKLFKLLDGGAGMADSRKVTLAAGYLTLGEFDPPSAKKAVSLLKQVIAGNDKKLRARAEFQLARAYRLGGQYGEAEELLDEMIGTAKKKGWAYGSYEVRKEKIYLQEAQKKLGDALKAWTSMASAYGRRAIKARNDQKPAERDFDRYFETYIERLRLLVEANAGIDAAKKAERYGKYAGQLVGLEKKYGELMSEERKQQARDLANEYPVFKNAYQAQGGQLLKQ